MSPLQQKLEQYHRWVAWSAEDQIYIGYCPDLAVGGITHAPTRSEAEELLSEALEIAAEHNESTGCWPPVLTHPTQALQL